jgi:hypothetical protein
MATAISSALPTDPKPFGIRGWLLLLCVVLTITTPIVEFLGADHDFRFGHALNGVFLIAHACFAEYCGILLWKKNRRGVTYTKYLFYINLGNIAIRYVPSAWKGLWSVGLFAVLLAGVQILWLLYLNRSKRVKNTYRMQSSLMSVPAP